jgi:hypothetical protein
VREPSDALTGLVKKIDERMADAPKPEANSNHNVFVLFTQNQENLSKQLRELAEKEALKKVSLCVGIPPKDYDVAGDADVTVVIYEPGIRHNPVVANFALRKGELTEEKTKEIVEALSKTLSK